MDLKTLILGAVLIALCILPIVLIKRSGKKARTNLQQSLNKLAKQNNSEISYFESFGDFIIGIDEIKKFVFFYKKANESTIEEVINLSDFKSCQVEKKKRALKSNNVNFLEIERLVLIFIPNSNDKNMIELEFYNINSGKQLTNELNSLEKWSEKLNKILKNKSK